MEDQFEKLLIEREELVERFKKLEAFLLDAKCEVSITELGLMHKQYNAMKAYLKVIDKRLEAGEEI